MKATYTECVITPYGGSPVYGKHRIIIRVDDQAAGPYLVIRGVNDDPVDGETAGDFFLESDEQINAFAATCKAMLKQAKESSVEAKL